MYLTSPLIMVAPEPGEPLLLYIVATVDAMSMVLVAERPNPHTPTPHELRSSSASGSGSQGLGPVEEPAGFQLPDVYPPSVFTGPHWTLFFNGSSRKQ
jgi:hypothetical protein